MHFLLNLAFGLLAGWLTDYLLIRAGVDAPIRLIVAIIVGLVVFFANIAAQVLTN